MRHIINVGYVFMIMVIMYNVYFFLAFRLCYVVHHSCYLVAGCHVIVSIIDCNAVFQTMLGSTLLPSGGPAHPEGQFMAETLSRKDFLGLPTGAVPPTIT